MELSMSGSTFRGSVGDVLSHNTVQEIKNVHNYYNADLHRFLSPLDPESRHITVRERHTNGTGEWLLDSKEFRDWCAGSNARLLCCMGDPGIGKTYLTCRVIEDLRQKDDTVVCHVYCDYQDKTRQTARNVLGALLSRVVTHLSSENDLVTQLLSRCRRGESLSLEETMEFLCKTTNSSGSKTIRLCLDALDELDSAELDKLLLSFSRLFHVPRVSIFATCRRNAGVENSIARLLREDRPLINFLLISTMETRSDRQLFLSQKLAGDRYRHIMDHDLEQTIYERLADKESTFLLASLSIETLLKAKNRRGRRNALDFKAKDLHDTYKKMIDRIKDQDDDGYGMRILQWVFYSVQPLKLQELQFALAINLGEDYSDPGEDVPLPSIIDTTLGLVTTHTSYKGLRRCTTTRFVHSTLKQYLDETASRYFLTGRTLLAETMLVYLTHDPSIRNYDARRDYRQLANLRIRDFHFYAVDNWWRYVQEEDNTMVQSICSFLQSDNFRNIQALCKTFPYTVLLHHPMTELFYSSPLHAVSSFGLPKSLMQFFSCGSNEGIDLNIRDGHGCTPFTRAIEQGHLNVVEVFLDNGIDLSLEYGRMPLCYAAQYGRVDIIRLLLKQKDIEAGLAEIGSSALSYAAKAGQLDIVKLLLETKVVSIKQVDDLGRTPLWYAAEGGNVDITRLFLEQEGVDLCSVDYRGQTALSSAAGRGNVGIVKLLLKQEGVDVGCPDKEGETAFFRAVGNGEIETVELLLGADVELGRSEDKFGQTVLAHAAEKGHLEIVRLLLRHVNVDVNAADDTGRTALMHAAEADDAEMLKLLLEQEGIRVDAVDRYGETALICAAWLGVDEAVELLLRQEGVDVNAVSENGRSALLCAARGGNAGKLKFLFEQKDLNLELADNDGRTPFSWAAAAGGVEAVELFLKQQNININSADKDGRTPLLWAAEESTKEVVALLLAQEDININSVDNVGRTPLLWAAWRGTEEVVELLLAQENMDVKLADNNGRTALTYAVWSRSPLKLGLLLKQNKFDVNSADGEGRTALSYAAGRQDSTYFRLLMNQKDIDPGLYDKMGRTALSYAAEAGNVEIVRLLLGVKDIEVRLRDKNGLTARSYAERMNKLDVVELLRAWEEANMEMEESTPGSSVVAGEDDIDTATRDIIKYGIPMTY